MAQRQRKRWENRMNQKARIGIYRWRRKGSNVSSRLKFLNFIQSAESGRGNCSNQSCQVRFCLDKKEMLLLEGEKFSQSQGSWTWNGGKLCMQGLWSWPLWLSSPLEACILLTIREFAEDDFKLRHTWGRRKLPLKRQAPRACTTPEQEVRVVATSSQGKLMPWNLPEGGEHKARVGRAMNSLWELPTVKSHKWGKIPPWRTLSLDRVHVVQLWALEHTAQNGDAISEG